MPTEDGNRLLRPLLAGGWVVLGVAVSTAVVLALLRLGDPSSRRLVELVTLTPLGLPLAATGAVVAGVVVVASRRRRLPVLALVAALVVAGVHTWWLAPLYVANATGAGPGPLVVMSLNFEVGDADALADATRDHDVDVLVLLEATDPRLDELRATGIAEWLPHAVGVEDELASGTVVLSRLPVVASAPLYDGADSLVVDLDAAALGEVRVVAVHTRPPYQPQGWRADHQEIDAVLSRVLMDDGPVLLAGDFNATLAHAPMRRILDRGFTDAADQIGGGWSPTWPSGGHERRFGMVVPAFAPIDHVLTSPELVVTGAETIVIDGADHRAVLASVSGADS